MTQDDLDSGAPNIPTGDVLRPVGECHHAPESVSASLTSREDRFPRKIVAAVRYRLRRSTLSQCSRNHNLAYPCRGSQATSIFLRSNSLQNEYERGSVQERYALTPGSGQRPNSFGRTFAWDHKMAHNSASGSEAIHGLSNRQNTIITMWRVLTRGNGMRFIPNFRRSLIIGWRPKMTRKM